MSTDSEEQDETISQENSSSYNSEESSEASSEGCTSSESEVDFSLYTVNNKAQKRPINQKLRLNILKSRRLTL